MARKTRPTARPVEEHSAERTTLVALVTTALPLAVVALLASPAFVATATGGAVAMAAAGRVTDD